MLTVFSLFFISRRDGDPECAVRPRDIMTDGSVQRETGCALALTSANYHLLPFTNPTPNTNRHTFLILCLSHFALASGYSPCSAPWPFGGQRQHRPISSFSSPSLSRLAFSCDRSRLLSSLLACLPWLKVNTSILRSLPSKSPTKAFMTARTRPSPSHKQL